MNSPHFSLPFYCDGAEKSLRTAGAFRRGLALSRPVKALHAGCGAYNAPYQCKAPGSRLEPEPRGPEVFSATLPRSEAAQKKACGPRDHSGGGCHCHDLSKRFMQDLVRTTHPTSVKRSGIAWSLNPAVRKFFLQHCLAQRRRRKKLADRGSIQAGVVIVMTGQSESHGKWCVQRTLLWGVIFPYCESFGVLRTPSRLDGGASYVPIPRQSRRNRRVVKKRVSTTPAARNRSQSPIASVQTKKLF